MRRFVSPCVIFLCFSLIVSFIGCGPVAGSGKPGQPTIRVWHWMTDREPTFQKLAKKYEEMTGVRVEFELYAPSDAYSQKVRAAAQGMTLPDVFGLLGEKRDFSSFIKAGHILDLTAYMEENNNAWKNTFFAKALAVNEFPADNIYGVKPGFYGVPLDVMTIKMLYNKDLFKSLGFNPQRPPATFAELLEVGKKIKEANTLGLVSGWGEIWMIDCFANNYAFNIMGKDKVLDTIRGKVPYTDPDWIKVFGLFKELHEAGVFANGLVTMVNKTAEQLFANGRAVFAFNGSWCVNVYKEMNPDLNYGVMMPPKVSDKFPMMVWGGAGSSLMVNARSNKREEAVKFLKWLTDKEQQAFLAGETNNLPSNKDSVSKLPEILAQFSRDMEQTTHPNTWGVSEFPAVIEALDKGIQSIIIGESTPEQLAGYVQNIKERELAKKR
ncbi:MAG: extracellular solute-binding protein [Candidatus Omnitrophica bacterium]|nr:extracellular solute-binding protein [Candidatus Omnitrophota bacterium]